MAEVNASPKPQPDRCNSASCGCLTLITGMIFLAAVLINIANVIGRYVFSYPIFWAEEVLVFMVIWAVFLSAVVDHLQRRAPVDGSVLRQAEGAVEADRQWRHRRVAAGLHRCSRPLQSYKVVTLYLDNGNVSTAAGDSACTFRTPPCSSASA